MAPLDSEQLSQNIQDRPKDTWDNGSQPEISIAFRENTVHQHLVWTGHSSH